MTKLRICFFLPRFLKSMLQCSLSNSTPRFKRRLILNQLINGKCTHTRILSRVNDRLLSHAHFREPQGRSSILSIIIVRNRFRQGCSAIVFRLRGPSVRPLTLCTTLSHRRKIFQGSIFSSARQLRRPRPRPLSTSCNLITISANPSNVPSISTFHRQCYHIRLF